MTPRERQQLDLLLKEQEELARAVQGYGERLRQFVASVEKSAEPASAKPAAPPVGEDEAAAREQSVEALKIQARAQLAAKIDNALGQAAHLPPPLPERAPLVQGVGAPPPRVSPPSDALNEATASAAESYGPPDERGYREPLGATVPLAEPAKTSETATAVETRGGGAPTPRTQAASPASPASPAKESQSLEMTLGTVWLARIGIVILITGLVFLGNFAWQHIVHRLGPGGKVSLLYLAAAALAGAGVWLEKRMTSVGRYPQVLMAGGAATAYYTTYAAYFIRPLKIIESPFLAGVLLLIVGGLFVWWADRRKLQTAALLGILLSYYTAAINPIGSFTVYSGAVLAAAAGLLLVRNGWAMVSWASLVGTYGSYVFWMLRSMSGVNTVSAIPGDPHDPNALAQLPGNVWFLGLYWLLFTASVFLARTASFASFPRAAFLSANNALFFALASNYVWFRHRSEYWAFVLGYGVVLLVLAALARMRHTKDYQLDGSYLVQGIAVFTAGLALKISGPQLAVTLAVESAVLLAGVSRRHGAIYRIGAVTCAVWAFCLTMLKMSDGGLILPLGGTVAALLLFDSWWLKQRSGWLPAMRWSWRAAGFAGLGLLLIAVVLLGRVHSPWEAPSFAVAALIATASIYLLRLPEMVLLGQLYLAVAVGLWLNSYYPGYPLYDPLTPWWQPLPIILASLGLAHWWQRQRIMRSIPVDALHLVCAMGFVAMGYFWMKMWLHEQTLAVGLTVAGVATLLYGYFTRAWAISALGQVFAAAGIFEVYRRFGWGHFPWFIALLPIAGVVASALILARSEKGRWPAEFDEVRQPAVVFYWLLTFVLTVGWVFEYLPAHWQLLVFAALGAVLFVTSARWPGRPRSYTALAFGAITLVVFWTRFGASNWLDLLALLLLPGAMRMTNHFAPATKLPAPIPETLVGLTTASVWLWVTRWIYFHGHVEMLTVAWSALAVVVFIAGLTLRERIYRIGGFLILALAIGRIYLVDVWKLETVYRILSFMVLGIVLLALGFVYNRYADRIRRWL